MPDNGIKTSTRVELEGNSNTDDTAGMDNNIANGVPGPTGVGDFVRGRSTRTCSGK